MAPRRRTTARPLQRVCAMECSVSFDATALHCALSPRCPSTVAVRAEDLLVCGSSTGNVHAFDYLGFRTGVVAGIDSAHDSILQHTITPRPSPFLSHSFLSPLLTVSLDGVAKLWDLNSIKDPRPLFEFTSVQYGELLCRSRVVVEVLVVAVVVVVVVVVVLLVVVMRCSNSRHGGCGRCAQVTSAQAPTASSCPARCPSLIRPKSWTSRLAASSLRFRCRATRVVAVVCVCERLAACFRRLRRVNVWATCRVTAGQGHLPCERPRCRAARWRGAVQPRRRAGAGRMDPL